MKKRWMGLAAAILLAVSPVLLSGACAESELLYKMQRQLDAGSGLKGTVTVSGPNGLEGLTLNAQYILQKDQSQTVLSLKGGDGGELVKTILYGQDEALVLDAGLTSGKLYSFTGGWESLLGGLVAGDGAMQQTPGNAALLNIFFPEDENESAKLSEAAAPYLTKIDLWMQGFANAPELAKDAVSGVTVIKVSYHIPAAAFKAELKQLLMDLLADKTLLPLLWAKMTQEQADLYLNPALQSFYFQAVDALPLSGEITMLRRVSTAGQLLETSVSLPLGGTADGLQQLSFAVLAEELGEALEVALETNAGTWSFTRRSVSNQTSLVQRQAYEGIIRYLPAEIPNWQVDATTPMYAEKALSVSYQTAFAQWISVDDEGKNNEDYTLSIRLAPDWSHLNGEVTEEVKAQYAMTDPVQLDASLQIKSGQARNASTSLNAQVHVVSDEIDWKLDGQFKTTPPWSFQPVDMAAAEQLENQTQEQLNALVMEFFSKPSLLPLLINLVPLDQNIPGTVG